MSYVQSVYRLIGPLPVYILDVCEPNASSHKLAIYFNSLCNIYSSLWFSVSALLFEIQMFHAVMSYSLV